MTLKELTIGQKGIITKVGGEGVLRQHFLDMGVIPGAEIELIKFAPMGDPMELRVHGYELTLRLDDAAKIDIEPVKSIKKTSEAYLHYVSNYPYLQRQLDSGHLHIFHIKAL